MNRRRSLEEFARRARGVSRQAQLDAAAAEVLDRFDAVGVQALVLKGPALAQMLYRPGEHRGYSDVDLLVAPSALDRSRAALAAIGYESTRDSFGVEDDVAGVAHAELWVLTRDREAAVQVDLHWRLAGCDAPAGAAFETLAARRTWIEVAGRQMPVLDRLGLALHLATHAAQHGPGDLKSLGDLERAIDRWPNELWHEAARLAAEVEAVPAFAGGLRLVPAGARLASELDLPVSEQLMWAIENREERPRGTFHLDALARARGTRERADILRRSVLPSRKWMFAQYPGARASRRRLAAAYVVHLARSPVWAARAWRYRRRERRARD